MHTAPDVLLLTKLPLFLLLISLSLPKNWLPRPRPKTGLYTGNLKCILTYIQSVDYITILTKSTIIHNANSANIKNKAHKAKGIKTKGKTSEAKDLSSETKAKRP